MKVIIVFFILISFYIKINAQNKKIIWDDQKRTPIEYAIVKSSVNYAISNENGEFNMENLKGILNIQRFGYQNIEINSDYFIKNDTIKMMPYFYQLEEIVVTNDDKFKKMVNTILTDYALEPHQENFFLRVILKKNDEYYKIIDFSGQLERKTLFDVSSKPMPKNNLAVNINNMRKVGLENRNLDFEMLSFENFLTRIASIYLSPKIYNFENNISHDNSYTKLDVTPKDMQETNTTGYYLINNIDNSFHEVFISNKENNKEFSKKGNIRYRTTSYELKTNFKQNQISNKYQLNMSVFKSNVETILDNEKNNFDITYVYYAVPLNDKSNIKNNINLNKDMFDLNIKYNPEYWKNHEILPLTNEIQEFINKVNSMGRNSDFRTKSNIK